MDAELLVNSDDVVGVSFDEEIFLFVGFVIVNTGVFEPNAPSMAMVSQEGG